MVMSKHITYPIWCVCGICNTLQFRRFTKCVQCFFRFTELDCIDFICDRCKSVTCPKCGVENVP